MSAGALPGVCLASSSLAELLDEARGVVLREGAAQQTQRGATRSLNGVMLTWEDPERDTSTPGQWRQDDIAWYLNAFVAPRPENDPARPAVPGGLVFPYTYAARARFWDGGWGYLMALLRALRATNLRLMDLTRSREAFVEALGVLGEHLHVQTILSLCALYSPRALAGWLARPELVASVRAQWQRDLLAGAIGDIGAAPQSRRAVVSALCYPQLEELLQPRMALPPYQLFQLLPGEPDGPLDSIHVHRSLDVGGGAPLDFYHDLAWLREASAALDRPIGSITIVAHNLHAYDLTPQPPSLQGKGEDGPPLLAEEGSGVRLAGRGKEEMEGEQETIQQWLCRVTDGYVAGAGISRELVRQPQYEANIARIWARWREEAAP